MHHLIRRPCGRILICQRTQVFHLGETVVQQSITETARRKAHLYRKLRAYSTK